MPPSQAAGDPLIRITIHPAERYQIVQGFGLNFTGPYFRDDQKEMFDTLIKDLGASLFRVVPYFVYSDWEVANDNDDPAVMNWEYYENRYSSPVFEATWNALRFLNSRGIRPVIALMGPVPDWMLAKTASPPRHSVCQAGSKIPPLDPAKYDEFAEMVVSMVMYARKQAGVDFQYFSPFNETDCYPPEGPRIDPQDAPKVLAAVARRLNKEGLGDVRLTPADQAIITNDYIGPILREPEVMKQVGAFTLHTYGSDPAGPQVERVKASGFAHVPVWLTEYGDLNDEDRTAENEWKHYSLAANRRALTALNQGVNAVFYFDAFDDYEECARRLTYYGLFTSAGHVYSPKKRYYATRQLFHFVRPESQRITATPGSPEIVASAFYNRADETITVVGVKEGGGKTIQLVLTGPAMDVPEFELYTTTRLLDCARVGTIATRGRIAEFELPDDAVFTLTGKVRRSGP